MCYSTKVSKNELCFIFFSNAIAISTEKLENETRKRDKKLFINGKKNSMENIGQSDLTFSKLLDSCFFLFSSIFIRHSIRIQSISIIISLFSFSHQY